MPPILNLFLKIKQKCAVLHVNRSNNLPKSRAAPPPTKNLVTPLWREKRSGEGVNAGGGGVVVPADAAAIPIKCK